MDKPENDSARRQSSIAVILAYLRSEFRAYDVSPFPEYRITLRDGSAKVVHELNFRIEFLDDHQDREVQRLTEWGLVSYMKQVGATPVWVSTTGLSTWARRPGR
jgi:hypothetical protein